MVRHATFLILLTMMIVCASPYARADLGPSEDELQSRITEIETRLEKARGESANYESGLIKAMIDLRIQVMEATIDMLQQKMDSFFSFIDLDYTVDGHPVPPISKQELSTLRDTIASLEAEIEQERAKAAQYKGGLILSMILAQIETKKVTLASLQMRYLTAQYGIPLFQLEAPRVNGETEKGRNIVEDKDAL